MVMVGTEESERQGEFMRNYTLNVYHHFPIIEYFTRNFSYKEGKQRQFDSNCISLYLV